MAIAGKQANGDNAGEEANLSRQQEEKLQAGLDYYLDNALLVFTADFLRKRGYCCESGCRHCPYEEPSNKSKQKD
jgi:hypothetical protein